jgi:hypothetical protein
MNASLSPKPLIGPSLCREELSTTRAPEPIDWKDDKCNRCYERDCKNNNQRRKMTVGIYQVHVRCGE